MPSNIKYCVSIATGLLFFATSFSQPFKVLHYTETSGYDHLTRNPSFAMFKLMGQQLNFAVDHDSTGQAFNTLTNLQSYRVVIFSNTTGNTILDAIQRKNMEDYINAGGRFIGIHSASDTYRHSSANGSNTGSWDWYAEMLGASVQENPHHVNGTPSYKIESMTPHAILNGIPNPWQKAEEYYYWEDGYFNFLNQVLQKVEQTVGPNNLVNSYDSARAVTWYKLLPGGGKSFYTALGHDVNNYTGDADFYKLLYNAMLWITDKEVGIGTTNNEKLISLFPNPARSILTVCNLSVGSELLLINSQGTIVREINVLKSQEELSLDGLSGGLYILKCLGDHGTTIHRLVKE